MSGRFPGYDVLAKRAGLSWNDATRRAIDVRLAVQREPQFFSPEEWAVLCRLCDRILPQPADRPPVPIAALIDAKMLVHGDAGTRIDPMPWDGEAWRLALAAFEAQAKADQGCGFAALDDGAADALLRKVQHGQVSGEAWHRIPPGLFFAKRLLPDIVEAYYGHPTAWSEIGFGGPASPRGYVRMDTNRRDPWEAVEAGDHDAAAAMWKNRRVR
jgi:Gluconate 2-dehydrogenase subunit 3